MSLKPSKSPLPRSRSVSPITVAERLRLEQHLRRMDDDDPEKRNNSEERKVSDRSPSPLSPPPTEANNISSRIGGGGEENDDEDDASMAQDEPENLSSKAGETALSSLEALAKATVAAAASPKPDMSRTRHDSSDNKAAIPPMPLSPPPLLAGLPRPPPRMLPFPPLIHPLGAPPGSPGLLGAPSPNAPLPGGPPVRN